MQLKLTSKGSRRHSYLFNRARTGHLDKIETEDLSVLYIPASDSEGGLESYLEYLEESEPDRYQVYRGIVRRLFEAGYLEEV